MKCVLFFCLFLLAIMTISAKKHKNEQKLTFKKVFKECQKDPATHVEGKVFKKLKKHRDVELPSNFGDHKLCLLKGLGLINEDGNVNEDNLKRKVSENIKDLADADSIISSCSEKKNSDVETALELEKCLDKNNVFIYVDKHH